MRRYWRSEPSGMRSPWCRQCTTKAIFYHSHPHTPNSQAASSLHVAALRRTGHHREAPLPLRLFALTVLEDRGEADDLDVTWLRMLEAGATDDEIEEEVRTAALWERTQQPSDEQPTEDTGAALGGPEPPGTAPGAQTYRERGRSPEETTGQEGTG
jgi:hypothetical protein